MIYGKQIVDGTITQAKLGLVTPVSANDAATKTYVDTLIQQSLFNQDWKNSVRVAVGTNVNIASPGASLNGVAMNANDRVLLYGQTAGAENWLWVWNGAAVPMTRATDADGSSEVTPQAAVSVEEGADANKTFHITNTGAIIVGTTAITVAAFATLVSATPTTNNKEMVALVTTTDGDLATNTTMAGTPNNSSFVGVDINGAGETIGNGAKDKACYFSGDNGVTARAWTAIVSGDKLFWMGSIAGYQLAATDIISFNYSV